MNKDILFLTLKKRWFDQIKEGIKTEEYRMISPFFTTRLVNRNYSFVVFQNGYSKTSPRLKIEYLGYKIKNIKFEATNEYILCFAIQLGKIIEQ